MKRTLLTLAACCTMLFVQAELNSPTEPITPAHVNEDWMRATDGIWVGEVNGKSRWYKLDKNQKVMVSEDMGKNWMAVDNQMWSDKEGKQLKISENNLVWSANGGKTWVSVPDWTWQGSDGKWYKLDKDWTVWVK